MTPTRAAEQEKFTIKDYFVLVLNKSKKFEKNGLVIQIGNQIDFVDWNKLSGEGKDTLKNQYKELLKRKINKVCEQIHNRLMERFHFT